MRAAAAAAALCSGLSRRAAGGAPACGRRCAAGRVAARRLLCRSRSAGPALAQAAVRADPAALAWSLDSPVFYSNYPLDRAPALRKDPDALQQLLAAPGAAALLVSGRKLLVQPCDGDGGGDGDGAAAAAPTLRPVWFDSPAALPAALAAAADPAQEPLFLGLDPRDGGAPRFAIHLRAAAEADAAQQGRRYSWAVARAAGPSMSPGDAALAAVATGLAQWHQDNRYHGGSGAATLPSDAGHSRTCPETRRTTYPRIDPAIITLVTACGGSGWCLLGRKKGWPEGRYSTLAGFLEMGETLEQALAREVLEEAGVRVDLRSIRYHASQPWPFPRSLMVGFYAHLAPEQQQQQQPGSSAAAAAASGAPAPGGAPGGGAASAQAAALQRLSPEGRAALREQGLTPEEWVPLLTPALPDPVAQPDEMEDVRWFHRDWLSWAISNEGRVPGGFAIPGPYSLAHQLITSWLVSDGDGPLSTPQQLPPQQQQQAAAAAAAAGGPAFGAGRGSWAGDVLPQVRLDAGVQKYVLLRLSDRRSGRSRLLVWGATAAAYHNHILQDAKATVQRLQLADQLSVDVLGGGRIEHHPEQRATALYGYSAAFGPAPHEVAAAVLRRWHPFHGVTVSYQGY